MSKKQDEWLGKKCCPELTSKAPFNSLFLCSPAPLHGCYGGLRQRSTCWRELRQNPIGSPRKTTAALGTGRFQCPGSSPSRQQPTCVDAPLGAREIFKSGVARGRVLTCVRPLMRLTRRGPRWEFEDQVQFKPTRSRRLSQSWFSRSRLSTVRHPSPLTFPRLDSLAVATAPTPPQPELDKPHPAPAAPRRSGPSCWPAPPAPASAACGRACAPATSQPGRPCARPSVPPRWPQ